MNTDSLSCPSCSVYPASRESRSVLVLAHGAGAGQHHPFMKACARGLAVRGIHVVTFDFPYMQQRQRVPDRAPALEQYFRSVVGIIRHHELFAAHRLFIGGKSMGGRIATHLAAAGIDGLAGVVALGYPLHPPGKPDQLRAAHLPSIQTPVLIVQGERDAFGTPDEMRPILRDMQATVTLHVVSDGDHSFRSPGRAGGASDALLDVVATWMLAAPGA